MLEEIIRTECFPLQQCYNKEQFVIVLIQCYEPGHDEIPNSILKEFFRLLGPAMLKICNKSLEHEIFPESLKKAKLIPIFKAWDRKKQNNDRPISILCPSVKFLKQLSSPNYKIT